jgi:hypothetical protein
MTAASFFLSPGQNSIDLDQAPNWGNETVILDFCGGPYRFDGMSKSQANAIRQRYRNHVLLEDSGNCIVTQLLQVDDRCFRDINTRGWTYKHMEYRYLPEQVHVTGLKMKARLSLAPQLRGVLGTSLDNHRWFPGLVFENYFRILTAYRLLALGGIMLHSAGIVSGGKARLFLGHSGAGKSTLAELAHNRGLSILSDDLNALLPMNNRVLVEKVPFTGTFTQQPDCRHGFDLEGIYKLIKGNENTLGELGPGAAMSLLLSCSPFVNEDPFRFEQLADNLAHILRHAETRSLVFNLDGNCFNLF